jgi:hypothetical protein
MALRGFEKVVSSSLALTPERERGFLRSLYSHCTHLIFQDMEDLDLRTDSVYQYRKWGVIGRGCRHGKGRLGLPFLFSARLERRNVFLGKYPRQSGGMG